MTLYARIAADAVAEVIAGNDTPIAERFHPDFLSAVVEVPDGVTVDVGYLWDGTSFTPPPPPVEPPAVPRYVPVALLRERLETQGRWDAVVALLQPAQILKLATLRNGVDVADDEVRQVLAAAGADVEAALAP